MMFDCWDKMPVMSDDSAPIDIEKLMRDLQESGRQQRLIEAERPSGEYVGDVLRQSVDLARRVFHASRNVVFLEDGLDPENEWGLRFVAGSIAEEDVNWLRENLTFDVPMDDVGEPINYLSHPLVDPVRCTLDFVQRFARAAMDHLESLGHLVRDDVGFRAPAVLSRAALEACAVACYLTDEKASSAERMRRLWNLQCEQLTEEALRDESGGGVEARAHRDAILSVAESVGFKVRRVRPSERFRAPKVMAEDGQAHSSTASMIEALLTADFGKSMWQGLSDVAHSRSSGLMFIDDMSRERQIPAMRAESVALHTMPSLLAFAGLGDHLEEYLGWEELSWRDSFDPVLQVWHACSGGADDVIRQRLGLPPVVRH
jgi:hypothetical protein